jgi:hypothetical protein
VHYLSSPCTLSSLVVHSLSRLCTSIHPLRLLSAFIPSVHHVHLDRSIAPLYLLCYSTADPLNSLSTFRANPPIVQVGHYGQPTVTGITTHLLSADGRPPSATAVEVTTTHATTTTSARKPTKWWEFVTAPQNAFSARDRATTLGRRNAWLEVTLFRRVFLRLLRLARC